MCSLVLKLWLWPRIELRVEQPFNQSALIVGARSNELRRHLPAKLFPHLTLTLLCFCSYPLRDWDLCLQNAFPKHTDPATAALPQLHRVDGDGCMDGSGRCFQSRRGVEWANGENSGRIEEGRRSLHTRCCQSKPDSPCKSASFRSAEISL